MGGGGGCLHFAHSIEEMSMPHVLVGSKFMLDFEKCPCHYNCYPRLASLGLFTPIGLSIKIFLFQVDQPGGGKKCDWKLFLSFFLKLDNIFMGGGGVETKKLRPPDWLQF